MQRTIWGILFVFLLSFSCSGDDKSTPLNSNNNTNAVMTPDGWELSDLILSENLISIETSVDVVVDASSVTIPATQAGPYESLSSGDIVISAKKSGFLRRVVSVSNSGGDLVIQTEQASLTDAIQQGTIRGIIPLDFEAVEEVDGNQAENSFKNLSVGKDFKGTQLYQGNGLTLTLTEGYIWFTPDFVLDIELDWFSLKYFKAELSGQLNAGLAVEASYSGVNWSFGEELTLFRSPPAYITIPLPIGALVFEVTLSVDMGFEIGFSGDLTAEAGAAIDVGVRGGAEFSNDAWQIIAEEYHHITAIGPTMDISANTDLRVFIRPKVETKLMGLAGPTISIEPYGKLEVATLPTPSWTLSAGILGRVDCEVEILGHNIVDYHETLFTQEWQLAAGNLVDCTDSDGDGYGEGAGCIGTTA